jgi:hypothetical protein
VNVASEGGASKRPKDVSDDRLMEKMFADIIDKLPDYLTAKGIPNDEKGQNEVEEVRLTQHMLDTALCQTQTSCFAYAHSEAQGRGSHWKMHRTVLRLRAGAMTLWPLLTLPVVNGRC